MIASVALPGLMEALWIASTLLGDWRLVLPQFWILYALLFAGMLAAWKWKSPSRGALISWAIVFRLTLFFVPPYLSEDVYRYAWEGRVQNAGFSPYAIPPDAPALAPFRDALYDRVAQKQVSTVYPILTQSAFRAGDRVSSLYRRVGIETLVSAVLAQKTVFLAFDFGILALLLWAVKRGGLTPSAPVLWAWNPLVVIEFAGSGHNDALGIFCLLAGLLLWDEGRRRSGAAAFAASFLSKYLAVLFVPFWVWKKERRTVAVFCGFAAAGVLMGLVNAHSFGTGTRYIAGWQFNGSLFWIVDAVVGHQKTIAKALCAAAIVLIALWTGRRESDLRRAAFTVTAAALLFAPTVHPWYFSWMLPLLCFNPHPAFLVWNLTIPLSYAVWPAMAETGIWRLPPAFGWIEYAPVFVLGGWTWWRRRAQ